MFSDWKGGKMKDYSEILRIRRSPEMRAWRKHTFKKGNYQCQLIGVGCEKKNPHKLEANHIKLFSEYPELRFEPTNGIALCQDCHKYIRGREHRYEELFNLILNNNLQFEKSACFTRDARSMA